jgi:hypothetical protein
VACIGNDCEFCIRGDLVGRKRMFYANEIMIALDNWKAFSRYQCRCSGHSLASMSYQLNISVEQRSRTRETSRNEAIRSSMARCVITARVLDNMHMLENENTASTNAGKPTQAARPLRESIVHTKMLKCSSRQVAFRDEVNFGADPFPSSRCIDCEIAM